LRGSDFCSALEKDLPAKSGICDRFLYRTHPPFHFTPQILWRPATELEKLRCFLERRDARLHILDLNRLVRAGNHLGGPDADGGWGLGSTSTFSIVCSARCLRHDIPKYR
jgi:hypothetical protein